MWRLVFAVFTVSAAILTAANTSETGQNTIMHLLESANSTEIPSTFENGTDPHGAFKRKVPLCITEKYGCFQQMCNKCCGNCVGDCIGVMCAACCG